MTEWAKGLFRRICDPEQRRPLRYAILEGMDVRDSRIHKDLLVIRRNHQFSSVRTSVLSTPQRHHILPHAAIDDPFDFVASHSRRRSDHRLLY